MLHDTHLKAKVWLSFETSALSYTYQEKGKNPVWISPDKICNIIAKIR